MKVKLTIILLLVLGFFLMCPIILAEEFEIKHADSLEADKEHITIKGNILINYKDTVIEAPLGKIETNNEGKANKAIFSQRAKLKLKDKKLEANNITVLVGGESIQAEGNTISELKDKDNNKLIITGDYQELMWSGENANAKGNLKTTYKDIKIISDEARIIYKNNKPDKAIFASSTKPTSLEQPTNTTIAKEIEFDINTKDVYAYGDVKSTIWPDQKLARNKQDPILVNSEKLFIDNKNNIIIAKSNAKKVNINYQETNGESNEAYLYKNQASGKPEKIIFLGNANVTQADKQLISQEVLFNFTDKKLTSNTKTSIRPKTIIFKNEKNKNL